MPLHSNSHVDWTVYLTTFLLGLWSHAMADPWGTVAIVIAIIGGAVKLAHNLALLFWSWQDRRHATVRVPSDDRE